MLRDLIEQYLGRFHIPNSIKESLKTRLSSLFDIGPTDKNEDEEKALKRLLKFY